MTRVLESKAPTTEVKKSVKNISDGDALDNAKSTFFVGRSKLGTTLDYANMFTPLIPTLTATIVDINEVYANARYNKKICNLLMDRINTAEFAITTLQKQKMESGEDFRNLEYYNAFVRFIDVMKRIKAFIRDVSQLQGYKRIIYSRSIKSDFELLVKDFDSVMTDLHFTMAVANESQRRKDQEVFKSYLSEIAKVKKQSNYSS